MYLYLSPVSESFIGWFFSLYLHSLALTFKGTWGNISAFELQVHLSWSFEFIYKQKKIQIAFFVVVMNKWNP